jgi:hypothetical protein
MASHQAARQRKGVIGAPRSGEALVQVANAIAEDAAILSASLLGGGPSIGIGGIGGGSSISNNHEYNNNGPHHSSGNINLGTLSSSLNGPSYHLRQNNRQKQQHQHPQQQQQQQPVIVATVKRNKYGTSPFDENWLNLDCCGLFCAVITYMLHLYGIYATCLVLIPPWMSSVDELGIRTMSVMGHTNRLAFTTIAVLAMYAHWKAMMTDPGAVPPDAVPLAEQQKQKQQQQQLSIKMGSNNTTDLENNMNDNDTGDGTNNNNLTMGDGQQQQQQHHQTSSMMQEDTSFLSMTPPVKAPPPPPPPRQGKRLCRRCNTFKPKRAHHCSICKRCIIKMDRKCDVDIYIWGVAFCFVYDEEYDGIISQCLLNVGCMGSRGHGQCTVKKMHPSLFL